MTKHGMKNTPEYMAWNMMKQRCLNQNHKAYPRYGGKGITICDAWIESFENFFAHMGERPSPAHSLDRWPNKRGGYEPGNVRWATRIEQQNNMTSNRMVFYLNREMTFAEAWKASPRIVPLNTAWQRLQRGWTVNRAMETRLDTRFVR